MRIISLIHFLPYLSGGYRISLSPFLSSYFYQWAQNIWIICWVPELTSEVTSVSYITRVPYFSWFISVFVLMLDLTKEWMLPHLLIIFAYFTSDKQDIISLFLYRVLSVNADYLISVLLTRISVCKALEWLKTGPHSCHDCKALVVAGYIVRPRASDSVTRGILPPSVCCTLWISVWLVLTI